MSEMQRRRAQACAALGAKMSDHLRIRLTALVLPIAVVLAGCASGSSTTPPPGASVGVTPPSLTLGVGQSFGFTATIDGVPTSSVAWSVVGAAGGTVSAQGLFTASATTGSVKVVATSQADPARSASADVEVLATPQVLVSVSPKAMTVTPGQACTFAATVSGSSNTAVTWSVLEAGGGTVGADGNYLAPNTPGTYHVVATSQADPARSDRAVVSVTAPPVIGVSITPRTTSLQPGQQATFTAVVANSANQSVAWTVVEAGGGTITAAGVYTAPQAAGTYHVAATAAADPTRRDEVPVVVNASGAISVTISPRERLVAVGGQASFSASVANSTDQQVNWTVEEAGGGTITAGGVYTAPQVAGTFHVVATARVDATKSDRVTAIVTAPVGDLAAQLAALSGRAILFGHQSVGGQIVGAVNGFLAANAGPEPTMVANARNASQLGTGIWGEFGAGANAYPAGKIDDFVAVMDGGAAAKVNVAFLKYCYVDFFDSAPYWSTGTVVGLFSKYRAAMAQLRSSHPGLAIVHFTVPLFTSTETNARREEYSDLVRAQYAGTEPVFDIALIESTRADGSRCRDGRGVPALCPEYTTDGGHLNAAGQDLVARALVKMLAGLP